MGERINPTSEYLEIIQHGAAAWNAWRKSNPNVKTINLEGLKLQNCNLYEADLHDVNLGWADLRGADLSRANLRGVDLTNSNLSDANLSEANLSGANLFKAKFRMANLYKAILKKADVRRASLYRANLAEANLIGANLSETDLAQADLRKANLRYAILEKAGLSKADLRQAKLQHANISCCHLVEARMENCDISGCRVYGISAWNIMLEDALQSDLIITPEDEPIITVDNLEIAHFIYLLLNNEKIRNVIETTTSKLVLILGRFSPKRKAVLNAIRNELRHWNYLPVLFDFDKPATRDYTETISTLAHLARFIIADISEPRSIPQELERIVKDLPNVPIQPIIQSSEQEYGMLEHYKNYPWFLKLHYYSNPDELIESLHQKIIQPAENYLRKKCSKDR